MCFAASLIRTDASVVHHKHPFNVRWLLWFPTNRLCCNSPAAFCCVGFHVCYIVKLVPRMFGLAFSLRVVDEPVARFSVPLPHSRGVYSDTRGVNAFLHSRHFPYAWAAVQHANQQLLFLPNSFFFRFYCCFGATNIPEVRSCEDGNSK